MALKWLFFFLKNCKNCPVAVGFAPGSYLGNLAFSKRSKNVQNVIQMAFKWLIFFEKLQELPSG